MMALSLSYVAWHSHAAYAKGGGDDSGGGDDDDGGDDDGGGGDKPDKGGGDDDDDQGDGSDQPPVTAGGLYTLQTYPLSEIERPLTITKGITQLRLGIGTDISAKGAFGSVGVNLEGEYGVYDNFMLIGGLTDSYNFKQYDAYFGFEGAIVYDLLDFRMDLNVHRNAAANLQNFCSPLTAGDPHGELFDNMDPSTIDMSGGAPASNTCQNKDATLVTLPDGTYARGGTKVSIDIGFPLRYAFKPQVALVLGQSILSIDFNSVDQDHFITQAVPVLDGMGNPTGASTYKKLPVANGAKPDLNLSAGIALNPIPQLSVVAYAALKIADFDTSADNFQVPVTLRIEGALSRQLDLGFEFSLLNIKPPAPQSPIDARYISAFAQARY
ncbi:MAG TPA: hypothetical protein VIV58_12995 [Kofleriaceae bacterium]